MIRELAAKDHRFHAAVETIVASEQFRKNSRTRIRTIDAFVRRLGEAENAAAQPICWTEATISGNTMAAPRISLAGNLAHSRQPS